MMKKVAILINSSAITTAVIKKILAGLSNQHTVLITVRRDEVLLTDPDGLRFHSNDESYVLNHAKISEIFDVIFKAFGKDIEVEVYTPCGRWLFCELLYALPIVKKLNYIEEGLGGYSGILDFINQDHEMQTYFSKAVHSAPGIISLKEKLVFICSSIFSRPLFLAFNLLWKLGYLKLAIFVFKIYRRSKKDISFLGALDHYKTGNFYTTVPMLNLPTNTLISLDINEPLMQENKVLILLPPSQHISDEATLLFFEKITLIIEQLKNMRFFYKSHPADYQQKFCAQFRDYFADKVTSIDHIAIQAETAIWAYENNYVGLISYQSAATFYAIQIGNQRKNLLCLDLSKETSNVLSPSIYVAKKLNMPLPNNITESTNHFIQQYTQEKLYDAV